MARWATYEDLTEEQIKKWCNGCGPMGWGWLVPDLIFKLAGNKHDAGYQFGGGWPDKIRVDCAFLGNCLSAAYHELKRRRRYWFYFLSFVYFGAVLLGGRRCFRWGKRMTIDDLSGIRENGA